MMTVGTVIEKEVGPEVETRGTIEMTDTERIGAGIEVFRKGLLPVIIANRRVTYLLTVGTKKKNFPGEIEGLRRALSVGRRAICLFNAHSNIIYTDLTVIYMKL